MRQQINKWQILLLLVGTASGLYFIPLCMTLGMGYSFNYLWLLLTAACFAVAGGWHFLHRISKWCRGILVGVLIVALLLFITIESLVVFGAFQEPQPAADYVIVLGAKVNGSRPSKRLQERIDVAADYAKRYPDVKLIASGGQGVDEGISEAQAIYNGLLEQGVKEEQILLEDQSVSTEENLVNSSMLIEDLDSEVVIATSDFHVFRATHVAKKYGYQKISGLPAPATSHYYLTPNYYVREFFGVINDFVFKP